MAKFQDFIVKVNNPRKSSATDKDIENNIKLDQLGNELSPSSEVLGVADRVKRNSMLKSVILDEIYVTGNEAEELNPQQSSPTKRRSSVTMAIVQSDKNQEYKQKLNIFGKTVHFGESKVNLFYLGDSFAENLNKHLDVIDHNPNQMDIEEIYTMIRQEYSEPHLVNILTSEFCLASIFLSISNHGELLVSTNNSLLRDVKFPISQIDSVELGDKDLSFMPHKSRLDSELGPKNCLLLRLKSCIEIERGVNDYKIPLIFGEEGLRNAFALFVRIFLRVEQEKNLEIDEETWKEFMEFGSFHKENKSSDNFCEDKQAFSQDHLRQILNKFIKGVEVKKVTSKGVVLARCAMIIEDTLRIYSKETNRGEIFVIGVDILDVTMDPKNVDFSNYSLKVGECDSVIKLRLKNREIIIIMESHIDAEDLCKLIRFNQQKK